MPLHNQSPFLVNNKCRGREPTQVHRDMANEERRNSHWKNCTQQRSHCVCGLNFSRDSPKKTNFLFSYNNTHFSFFCVHYLSASHPCSWSFYVYLFQALHSLLSVSMYWKVFPCHKNNKHTSDLAEKETRQTCACQATSQPGFGWVVFKKKKKKHRQNHVEYLRPPWIYFTGRCKMLEWCVVAPQWWRLSTTKTETQDSSFNTKIEYLMYINGQM